MLQLKLPFRRKFEVGDSVKILSKSIGWDLGFSHFKRGNMGYIVWRHDNLTPTEFSVWWHSETTSGDLFLESDLKRL